jgi:hypothetical protein
VELLIILVIIAGLCAGLWKRRRFQSDYTRGKRWSVKRYTPRTVRTTTWLKRRRWP